MEEKKQNLEFIAPEVKVVSVTSQKVLCQSPDDSTENLNAQIDLNYYTKNTTEF